jgi:amidophosphoribosyltransferase
MDELRHECGIAALYHFADGRDSRVWSGDPDQTTRLMTRMLLDLQNRGQLAAGFSSFNPDRDRLLDTFKELGTVSEAFQMSRGHKHASIMEEFAGRASIGHVRYATCGPTGRSYAQPFERQHGCKWKWFAFAFNGNLANLDELRTEVESYTDYHLTREGDTEVIMHLISQALRGDEKPDLVQVFTELSRKLDGAYNLVFLNALGEMVVLRDPLGLRPLCYATDGPLFAAASESVPLLNMGFAKIQSLEPGEMIVLQDGAMKIHRYAEVTPTAHCFFEWIYFANVASTLDGKSVYLSRSRLGEELAKLETEMGLFDPNDGNTIVVPVPDTGKAAADAMAYALGIRSQEGLIRNRYVGRTFIEPGNRADKVRLKFTPLREVLEGKRIILVEDSIVRSTTLKTLLGYLREAGGVKEIHVRVACPPIVAPCFYGIDMATVEQLYAPRFIDGPEPTREELAVMADDLGADSLVYLPLEAVARCIGLPKERLCRACLTGVYPTETGKRRYELELAVNGA